MEEIKEDEAVRMSCCGCCMDGWMSDGRVEKGGGWVGGWVGGLVYLGFGEAVEFLELQIAHLTAVFGDGEGGFGYC